MSPWAEQTIEDIVVIVLVAFLLVPYAIAVILAIKAALKK